VQNKERLHSEDLPVSSLNTQLGAHCQQLPQHCRRWLNFIAIFLQSIIVGRKKKKRRNLLNPYTAMYNIYPLTSKLLPKRFQMQTRNHSTKKLKLYLCWQITWAWCHSLVLGPAGKEQPTSIVLTSPALQNRMAVWKLELGGHGAVEPFQKWHRTELVGTGQCVENYAANFTAGSVGSAQGHPSALKPRGTEVDRELQPLLGTRRISEAKRATPPFCGGWEHKYT